MATDTDRDPIFETLAQATRDDDPPPKPAELTDALAFALQDEERRWRWVLETLATYVPPMPAERLEDPRTFSEIARHLAWLTREGACSDELDGKPDKAMRWACWAQGALVALNCMRLSDCKRLNMRATWESAKRDG
jgi:hypothetical protein